MQNAYLAAQTAIHTRPVILVKPLTYMNNSGDAVADIVERYNVALDELLIICDDFQLPLGSIRLRAKGSDGGHNGLRSVINRLQSREFPRLRCGIAGKTMPTKKSSMASYVLAPFEKDEIPVVEAMVDRARDAALTFVREGIVAAMNTFHAPQRGTINTQ